MDKTVLVIVISKFFEIHLGNNGAEGKGLHEKISSIEGCIPNDLIKKLRKIASIRNKQVHSDDASFEEIELLRDALDVAWSLNKCLSQENLRLRQTTRESVVEKTLQEVVEENIESDKSNTIIINLSDNSILKLLRMKQQIITEEELEELIDDANSQALAVYYPAYERWDAFQYLAKESKSDVDRLNNLALSLYAGADSSAILALTKKLISPDFLKKEYENYCIT